VRDLPNYISLFRLLLTIPTVHFLLEGRFFEALLLFFLAGISDGLDGFLAKRFGWQSSLGGLLDPLADKALLLSSLLVLVALAKVPGWLVALAVLRDMVIVSGALVYHYRIEQLNAKPIWSSKLNTLLQILLVLAVIAREAGLPMPGWLVDSLIWSTLLSILWSGVRYVWLWTRKARDIGPR
jgi:cardiolipin synthase